MNTKNLLICLAISALCGPPLLPAQATKQVTVNATVAEMLSLTIDKTSVAFAFVAADYDAATGIATKEVLTATTFSVTSNRAWKLSAKADTAAFSFAPVPPAADPNPAKPSSTLSIRTGALAYVPFSGVASQTVATGTSGGSGKTGNKVPVDYQMTSTLSLDPPGTYALTITYTLVAQ
jgi:hypothetical protein